MYNYSASTTVDPNQEVPKDPYTESSVADCISLQVLIMITHTHYNNTIVLLPPALLPVQVAGMISHLFV